MNSVEVRGFGKIKKIFDERKWPFPLTVDFEGTTTTGELAEKLEIPSDDIEVVFVNGMAQGMDCPVKPGDRLAFVPPGTPGPYRVFLGFVQKKQTDKRWVVKIPPIFYLTIRCLSDNNDFQNKYNFLKYLT